MSAKFITIEGQDGAGKSTNLAVIEDCLKAHKTNYIKTREPGGTELGEWIREVLLDSDNKQIEDMAELLLIFAARAQHLQQVIEPALAKGQWVLCDRFTDATYAYQGGGRNLSMQKIAELEELVQGSRRPDLTILLDLPVEVGESRAGKRSRPDRFELQQMGFKQKVRDCYLSMAAEQSQRIKVVDASQNLTEVSQSIEKIIHKFCNDD